MNRLALFGQSYPPMVSGAALVMQRLAEGLAARGHAVLVGCASPTGQPGHTTQALGRGHLQVEHLASWHNPLRVGQRFAPWPRPALERAARAFGVQVIHAHDPLGAQVRLGVPAAVPVAYTLHQLPWFVAAYLPRPVRPLAERVLWHGLRQLARRCALVTPSATIAEVVAAHGLPRPTVISNGVDVHRFTPAPHPTDAAASAAHLARLNLPTEVPLVLHVGRLDAEKKVETILHALAGVTWPHHLVVAGDGVRRAALEAQARALGVPATFTGYIHAELPALYRHSRVLVSASEVEIQSSIALEGAASGLPMVAVRASSMAELVQDGRTGWLAPPGDVSALRAALITALAEPATARAFGLAARAWVEANHHPEATLRAHETLYARLIEQSAAQR